MSSPIAIPESGVYWPIKTLLEGSGIVLTQTGTSITIATTGSGPGGGDMLKSEYATNGNPGIVDEAVVAQGLTSGSTVPRAEVANSVAWGGITGVPSSFPTSWSSITGIPSTFPPSTHGATHLPGGSDPIGLASSSQAGLLSELNGQPTYYVGGDNAVHPLPGNSDYGDLVPPSSPSVYNDEFTSTTINPQWTVSGVSGARFCQMVQPTYLQMGTPQGQGGVVDIALSETVSTAANWLFQFKQRLVLMPAETGTDNASSYLESGILLQASTNKAISVFITAQAYQGSSPAQVYYYTSISVYRGAAEAVELVANQLMFTGLDVRIQIGQVGSQLVVNVSNDAWNWVTVWAENYNTGNSFTGQFPVLLQLSFDNSSTPNSANAGYVAWDYVRKIA
jgi:hypothetical protein